MAIAPYMKGITQVPITLLQSHDTTGSLKVADTLLDFDATPMDDPLDTFDPTHKVDLKGKGSLPAALALVGILQGFIATHEALTGGVCYLLRNKYTQHAQQHDEWEVQIGHWPNGIVPT